VATLSQGTLESRPMDFSQAVVTCSASPQENLTTDWRTASAFCATQLVALFQACLAELTKA